MFGIMYVMNLCYLLSHSIADVVGSCSNAPSAPGGMMSAGSMIPQMAANDSNVAAAYNYTQSMTANNTGAANWGSTIDMSVMPAWSHSFVAENIMYTRSFLAANPE